MNLFRINGQRYTIEKLLKVQFVLTILNLKELYLIQIVLKMQINTSEVILKNNNTCFCRYKENILLSKHWDWEIMFWSAKPQKKRNGKSLSFLLFLNVWVSVCSALEGIQHQSLYAWKAPLTSDSSKARDGASQHITKRKDNFIFWIYTNNIFPCSRNVSSLHST